MVPDFVSDLLEAFDKVGEISSSSQLRIVKVSNEEEREPIYTCAQLCVVIESTRFVMRDE